MSSPLGERGLPPFNQQVTAAGPSDNVHQGGLIDWHGTGKGRVGITAKEKGGGCPTLSRMEDSSRTAQLFHGVCVCMCYGLRQSSSLNTSVPPLPDATQLPLPLSDMAT